MEMQILLLLCCGKNMLIDIQVIQHIKSQSPKISLNKSSPKKNAWLRSLHFKLKWVHPKNEFIFFLQSLVIQFFFCLFVFWSNRSIQAIETSLVF